LKREQVAQEVDRNAHYSSKLVLEVGHNAPNSLKQVAAVAGHNAPNLGWVVPV
jgi:hypothetical protein